MPEVFKQFQWVSDGVHRHGVSADLVAGEQATALCGESLVIPRVPLSQASVRVRCAPTCVRCDAVWRERTGCRPANRAELAEVERGEVRLREVDVIGYLTLCQTPRAALRRLVFFNQESTQDTWLQSFDRDLTLRMSTQVYEEARATRITGYHPLLIPPPLRTSSNAPSAVRTS
jgi:hypothetical protein